MDFIPEIKFGIYNAWLLFAIYYVINFGLMLMIPKHNIGRFIKIKKIKYTTLINYILYYGFFIISIFIPLKQGSLFLYIGVGIFILGIILYFASMFSFAVSEYDKPITDRMYKFTRHPIYMSFFILLIGISLSAASFLLLIITVAHIISTYFIMIEEEKQCVKKYGKEYIDYKNKVRRIF